MSTRDVTVRLFGDDGQLTKVLEKDKALLDEFGAKNPTAKLGIDDANAKLILDGMKVKLDAYGRMVETARLKINDTQALAELDKLELKMLLAKKRMQSLGEKNDLVGLSRLRNEVGKVGSEIQRLGLGGGGGGGSSGGFFRRLFGSNGRGILSFFGGGGGAGAALGAAESGGSGFGKDALSSLGGSSNYITGGAIGALAAWAATLAPSVIGLGIGGGVGVGGAGLAAMLGKTGASKILADQQALASARAAIAGSKSGGSPSQRLTLARDRAQLTHDQGIYGGFAPFGRQLNAFGGKAIDTLAGAMSASGPGGTSFLSGLSSILKGLGPTLTQIGPMLGQMFRASLPFLKAFAQELGPIAKTLFPAMTQIMKQMTPLLPTMMKGFTSLFQGISGFIKALGPGLSASAAVFRTSMSVIKVVLIGLGLLFSGAAIYARFMGHVIGEAVTLVVDYFKLMWRVGKAALDGFTHAVQGAAHSIANEFDRLRHAAGVAWKEMWQVIHAVVGKIVAEWQHFTSEASSIISRLWRDIVNFFKSGVSQTWSAVSSGFNKVVSFVRTIPGRILSALGNLGSLLFNAGKNVIQGLINGITSMIGNVGSAMSGIASTIRNFLPFSPAKVGPLSGSGSPDIAGRKVASMFAGGIRSGIADVHSASLDMAGHVMISPHGGGSYGISAGSTGSRPVQLVVSGNGDDLLKAIVKSLRYDIKSNGGGNVQQHLGWGSV